MLLPVMADIKEDSDRSTNTERKRDDEEKGWIRNSERRYCVRRESEMSAM